VNIYDTITKKKESFNVITKIPDWADGAMVEGKLYVMGGYNPIVKSTYEIDATKKEMVQKQDMITAKYGHSLCTLQNQIFSIGGWNGSKYLVDCEVYGTKENT